MYEVVESVKQNKYVFIHRNFGIINVKVLLCAGLNEENMVFSLIFIDSIIYLT